MGPYPVAAAMDGFETTAASILVVANETARVSLDLPIANFADTIDVVAETAAVSNGQTLAR
jgi:hypothetical protein